MNINTVRHIIKNPGQEHTVRFTTNAKYGVTLTRSKGPNAEQSEKNNTIKVKLIESTSSSIIDKIVDLIQRYATHLLGRFTPHALKTKEEQIKSVVMQELKVDSVNKIANQWRKFLSLKNQKKCNAHGYVSMSYGIREKRLTTQEIEDNINNQKPCIGRFRDYYVDTRSGQHHVYKPENLVINNEKGSFKQVTHVDSRYVALSSLQSEKKFNKSNELPSEVDELKLKTLTKVRVVDDNLIIAKNAGVSLYDSFFNSKEKAAQAPYKVADKLKKPAHSPSLFKQACKDLDTLHKNKFYYGDIKPDNMMYNERLGMMVFIDADGLKKYDSGGVIYLSEGFFPGGIMDAMVLPVTSEERLKACRISDVYAMLHTLIISTFGDHHLAVLMETAQAKTNVSTKDSKTMRVDTGVLSLLKKIGSPYVSHIDAWINCYIKKNHRATVKKLLEYPSQFKGAEKLPYLADMLHFNGASGLLENEYPNTVFTASGYDEKLIKSAEDEFTQLRREFWPEYLLTENHSLSS